MVKAAASFRPHDLVRFSSTAFKGQDMPDWCMRALEAVPFAVIRRAQKEEGRLPVGIRGPERHQRWGGFIAPQWIEECLAPEILINRIGNVPPERLKTIPALAALTKLFKRFEGRDWVWGPTGSVGFELASGNATATASSDLDLIFRCDMPITQNKAALLLLKIQDLGVRCDALIETPVGAVALSELANADGRFVIRMTTGPILTDNPWLGE